MPIFSIPEPTAKAFLWESSFNSTSPNEFRLAEETLAWGEPPASRWPPSEKTLAVIADRA